MLVGQYSEDLGNLKDYDANQYILYFGDGSVHEGFEVVSDMVYEVDWEAIHKEIEESLPNTPGVTYQIEDVQVFYVSEDYIKAVEMNSRENLYFNGLTEQQMMEQYGDDWNFVYRDGKIIHHTEVPADNFDWGNFFTKIAIGVGVILIAATVTAVTGGGGAPVVIGCLISTAAKLTAVSAIAGVVAATVDYAMTGDINSSLNTFADGFQFTAVVSSIAVASGVIPPACFVAGTKIETNLGAKAIENIRSGDVVLSYFDESEEIEVEEAELTSQFEWSKEGKTKKDEKRIRDRKRNEKPQMSLFDLLAGPKEQSREEQLIENQLLRGSGFTDGKYRIYEKYFTNPTVKEYASFLKSEYGIGGYSDGHNSQDHDGKGIRMEWSDRDHPEHNIQIDLKWNEVAIRIADLIDEDMRKQFLKEIELLLPQGYAFEEVYETDETGYVSENESPALQEEVKLRIERKESNGTRRDIR